MSSRPRLLVLASTYPRWRGDHEPGFVHELARRLTREFDVMVLCPHAPGAATDEQMDGVQVHRFRYAPAALETLVNDGGIVTNLKRQRWKWLLVPAFGLALSWATWRALMRWQPDVVHAHWLLPQGAIIALARKFVRRRPPFVVTSHGADLFALRGAVLQSAKRWVARQAACITVVSAAMQDELTRLGIAPAQVQIEPMGVDLSERFAPDATVARSATEILFVGRLVEKKGLRHLLDAMPMILAQLPQARLTIAGFGPELEPRKAQARALGIEDALEFTGPVIAGRPAGAVSPRRRIRRALRASPRWRSGRPRPGVGGSHRLRLPRRRQRPARRAPGVSQWRGRPPRASRRSRRTCPGRAVMHDAA
jgi:glycosyltransferase involved in cell wall biosynthesis